MNDLSLDVLNLILDALKADLDGCTAVCLALTCRSFFTAYKNLNPDRINIWIFTQYQMWVGSCSGSEEIIVGRKSQWLSSSLHKWIGPRYRPVCRMPQFQSSLRRLFCPFFLNREVYGDSTANYNVGFHQEDRLRARCDEWWRTGSNVFGDENSWHLLPSPYSKGEK